MKESDEAPQSPSNDNAVNSINLISNLNLKDYLESAAEASHRTRFITIVMVVTSVLVLVSIYNSTDRGWITQRTRALQDTVTPSPYTARKFPILCRCKEEIKTTYECREQEMTQMGMFSEFNRVEKDLARGFIESNKLTKDIQEEIYKGEKQDKVKVEGLRAQQAAKVKDIDELKNRKNDLCMEERNKLEMFTEAMYRSAAETKYTVRVPFFGVAFDVNDLGILGGFGLLIILILLRLSLRSQIVSLRIGFKEAFAQKRGKDFYQILATRQVFVFPPLEDEDQPSGLMQGWIERWWSGSKIGKLYHRQIARFSGKNKTNGNVEIDGDTEPAEGKKHWRANRNVVLRTVPKLLSLLPFAIYIYQYINDLLTLDYGNELNRKNTLILIIWGFVCSLSTLVLGIWCITKWNEIDKLWDYYDNRIKENKSATTPPAE